MWIKMKKTYAGTEGLFLKGISYDVSEGKAKLLPADSFEPTQAPHERKDLYSITNKQMPKSPADKQSRPGKKGSKYKTK